MTRVTPPLLQLNAFGALEHLNFNNVLPVGSLPPSWKALTGLKWLYFYAKEGATQRLTGVLPDEWSAMTSLLNLGINNHTLSGSLPPSWSNITTLIKLWVDGNQGLYGTIPISWATLPNLQVITVLRTGLCGPSSLKAGVLQTSFETGYQALPSLTDCPAMALWKALGSPVSFQQPAPADICTDPWMGCASTTSNVSLVPAAGQPLISVPLNSLTAPLQQISKYSSIIGLSLSWQNFSGSIPEAWQAFTSLTQLALRGNPLITGSLPPPFSGLTALTVLDAGMCALTGTLPSAYGALTQLQRLVLDSNALTGPLPDSWGSLTQLQRMWLQYNSLTGPLPSSWGAFTALADLRLHYNQLTGPLPPSWGGLSAVQQLHLTSNPGINGPLPDEWAAMTSIVVMGLDTTGVTGTVPASWAALASWNNLALLNQANTFVCGAVPAAISSRVISNGC